MINIKDFDPNLLKIDQKSYKNIDIYYIGYITVKYLIISDRWIYQRKKIEVNIYSLIRQMKTMKHKKNIINFRMGLKIGLVLNMNHIFPIVVKV